MIVDMDMLDAIGWHGPKQEDVEMMDVFKEVFILDELDSHVIEP